MLYVISLTSLWLLMSIPLSTAETTRSTTRAATECLATAFQTQVKTFVHSRSFWANGCLVRVSCIGANTSYPLLPNIFPLTANLPLICGLKNLTIVHFDVNVTCSPTTRAPPRPNGLFIFTVAALFVLVAALWLLWNVIRTRPPPPTEETRSLISPSWRRRSMRKMTVIYILALCFGFVSAQPQVKVKATRHQWLCVLDINCTDIMPTYFSWNGHIYNRSRLMLELSEHLSDRMINCVADVRLASTEIDPRDFCQFPPTVTYVFKKTVPLYVTFLTVLAAYCYFPQARNPALISMLPVVLADNGVSERRSSVFLYLSFYVVVFMLMKIKKPNNKLFLLALTAFITYVDGAQTCSKTCQEPTEVQISTSTSFEYTKANWLKRDNSGTKLIAWIDHRYNFTRSETVNAQTFINLTLKLQPSSTNDTGTYLLQLDQKIVLDCEIKVFRANKNYQPVVPTPDPPFLIPLFIAIPVSLLVIALIFILVIYVVHCRLPYSKIPL